MIRDANPQQTEIEGVKNYLLKRVYAPVLDRQYLDKFNPDKTCISICGQKEFKVNDNRLIKEVIEQVRKVKNYYSNDSQGRKEDIGEYSLFDHINIGDYQLWEYTFDYANEEYYLILWFTPTYVPTKKHRHIYWYGKKHDSGWY